MTSADVVYSLNYQAKPGVPTSVYFANASFSPPGIAFFSWALDLKRKAS